MPLQAQERTSVSVGAQIGEKFNGIEVCGLSPHGSGMVAIQKFDGISSPDLRLGIGFGEFREFVYWGLLLNGVAGSYTGAGLGLHLRGGFSFDRFCIGVAGQTVAGTKKTHSEVLGFIGYRF